MFEHVEFVECGVLVTLRKDLSCAESEIWSDSACRVGRAVSGAEWSATPVTGGLSQLVVSRDVSEPE